MASYNAFASFYDRLIQPVDYPQRAAYFHSLLDPLLGSERLLLDLACGTGKLAVELAALGYEVMGVDASEEMLMHARQRADEAELQMLLIRQRMERLNLGGQVDCCVCALDSLNHLTDPKLLRRAIERVAEHLVLDGVFLFDMNTPYKHRVLLGEQCYCLEEGDTLCVWQNHTEGLLTEITLDFFTQGSDRRYTRTGESFFERGYEREEIEAILADCGLTVVALYGDDTLLPPHDTTERWIYLTKKRNG